MSSVIDLTHASEKLIHRGGSDNASPDHTSLASSHSLRTADTGANSPARLAILVSKDSVRRSESLACSAASSRALVSKTGDRPESEVMNGALAGASATNLDIYLYVEHAVETD